MRILFVNTHYFLPQSVGGMAITLHQLAKGLQGRGHEVAVLAGFRRGGLFGLLGQVRMRLAALRGGAKLSRDTGNGYPVWRSWNSAGAVADVAASERPDVIVIMGGQVVPAALDARNTGLPVVVQVHDVELHWHGGNYMQIADLPCIANSQFTAAQYRSLFGVEPRVVYPFIDPSRYRTPTTREFVTFVNPYLRKGALVAYRTALACPEIPFRFIGRAHEQGEDGTDLAAAIAALPNVQVEPPQSDMREVYRRTKILFAPSQWEEAYGRVATEAHLSGIPVLGSDRGGLPEAIGPGGVVLAHDAPIAEWTAALRGMWSDPALYDELSAAALAWSAREELDSAAQLALHEQAINEAISAQPALRNSTSA